MHAKPLDIDVENLTVALLENDIDLGSAMNTRSFEQFAETLDRIRSGKCPFCELDLARNKALYSNSQWRYWENRAFPKKHLVFHLVAAPFRHITQLEELKSDDCSSMGDMISAARRHGFRFPGDAIVMRFGDPKLNAGSVRHLHLNIQVPDGTGEVREPFVKKIEDIADKRSRVESWLQQYKEREAAKIQNTK